jgi:hypothetical protein
MVAGQESYTLPADFYLMRRIELQTNAGSATDWQALQPISLDLRSPGDPLTAAGLSVPAGWYILGGKLYVSPIPDQAYSGTLYYFKNATPMTSDGDTPIYPEGLVAEVVDPMLKDYVVAKALTRRQDPAYTIYAGRYDAGLGQIIRDAEERGNANPYVIVDDWAGEE